MPVEEGALDPKRTIQIGIRGPSEPLWAFSYSSGMTVIHIEELYAMGIEAVIATIRGSCSASRMAVLPKTAV